MKVKVFEEDHERNLESAIQRWLDGNTGITIHHMSQSQSDYAEQVSDPRFPPMRRRSFTVTILYTAAATAPTVGIR